MQKPQAYDREKFVETAQALEAARLANQEKWNEKNQDWIKEHGPIPFQVPKLIFGTR
ncbi:MAG: hypothetical protein RDU20_04205 [Desulfomonilaceae bacterium]|nr:hypothetical protein [Desulfomonilaceae bacterium]